MEIFPAIDLLGGKVVRLFQGDYGAKQEFGDDPAFFARQFAAAGAKWLHVVDLDGAKAGSPQNFDAVKRIIAESGLSVELGGGIRSAETVARCFEAGVGRVVLGTAALKNPGFARAMAARYGGAVAVGVDARDGRVATEGWLETSDADSFEFCRTMAGQGIGHIIYTDIARDGAGAGVGLDPYRRLAEIPGLRVTAAGGVTTLEDIKGLAALGLYGAIVGKALYTGDIRLEEAIAAAQ